jgi:hypothetical protein
MDNLNQPGTDPFGDRSDAEEAARARETMTDEARDIASDTMAAASERVAGLRDKAESVVGKAESVIGEVARDAQGSAREVAEKVRGSAVHASDSMTKYIREEPIKSVMLASIAGAALVAVASLLGGSRR